MRQILLEVPALWNLGEPGALRVVRRTDVAVRVAIDLPLSAVADTLLFPFELLARCFDDATPNEVPSAKESGPSSG